MDEPFMQGSQHLIVGIVRDRIAGVPTPFSLDGATMRIVARINLETVDNAAPQMKSSAAGDTTQTLTITGKVNGKKRSETKQLNGTSLVAFTKIFQTIEDLFFSAAITGAVTVYRDAGDTEVMKIKNWATTPDADQVANKGKYTYQLLTTDLDAAGLMNIQGVIVKGGLAIRTDWENRDVIGAVA